MVMLSSASRIVFTAILPGARRLRGRHAQRLEQSFGIEQKDRLVIPPQDLAHVLGAHSASGVLSPVRYVLRPLRLQKGHSIPQETQPPSAPVATYDMPRVSPRPIWRHHPGARPERDNPHETVAGKPH